MAASSLCLSTLAAGSLPTPYASNLSSLCLRIDSNAVPCSSSLQKTEFVCIIGPTRASGPASGVRAFQHQVSRLSVITQQGQSKSQGQCIVPKAVSVSSETDSLDVFVEDAALELKNASPFAVMDKALASFGSNIAIAFSGAEDVALIELARMTGRPFRVFALETGRLHAETYRYYEQVEKHYGIRIEYFFPEHAAVEQLVRTKGLFSFYQDGHQECCSIRKVQPLRRALSTLQAWVTGQRRDQSPGTRAAVPLIQLDTAFKGLGPDGTPGSGSLVKFNPLAATSSAAVWSLLQAQGVPTNPLHAQGFVSIGCEPCTRPVLPNQHEREGRWWWEDSTAKECGLHRANKGESDDSLSSSANGNSESNASSSAAAAIRDLFQDPSILAPSREDLEKLVNGSLDLRGDRSWLLVLYAPWCPFCQAMEVAFEEVARSFQGSNVAVAKFRADLEDRAYCAMHLQLSSFPTILFLPAIRAKDSQSTSLPTIKRTSERRDVKSLLLWVEALR